MKRAKRIGIKFNMDKRPEYRVYYEGQLVGEYLADLWVENRIIIELKAVRALDRVHEVQLVNYLTATGVNTGLLLNFGPSVQVKRKSREYRAG